MQIRIPTTDEFSFQEAIEAHGWRSLVPFSWDEETKTLSRVERLSDGQVVAFEVTDGGDDSIVVQVNEPAELSRVAKSEIFIAVRRMMQLDLSLNHFHDFCRETRGLEHIPDRHQGRLLRSPTVWEDVVKVITTTNTTWAMTKAMVQRMVDAYGSPLPSAPTRHAFPTPQQIAAVPFEDFQQVARVGYRTSAIHGLAQAITAGELDLEELLDFSITSVDLRKRLLALHGVGPYAASCLMIYLGRYDHVNVDSWARTLVGRELGRKVTDKETHAFFEPYGEWRALVYHFYPWTAAD